jgi:uncharacterized protein YegP (UPF0339 family)
MFHFEIYRRGLIRKEWGVRIVAANGEKLFDGYQNLDDARSAIDLVKREAPGAPVTVVER